MRLMHEDLKSYSRFIILSFWLVQNLSLFEEGFPASGNDNLKRQPLKQSSP